MANLKELKTRIASVKSTQKITKAMKLVAAAKMKRATDAALASRAYSNEVTAVLRSLMARVDAADHALLTSHDEVSKVAVILVTADRGLCGGFNNNLMRRVENWVWEQGKSHTAFSDVELQTKVTIDVAFGYSVIYRLFDDRVAILNMSLRSWLVYRREHSVFNAKDPSNPPRYFYFEGLLRDYLRRSWWGCHTCRSSSRI